MPNLYDVYRFLLTPRWVILHIVVLLVIPAFVFLGNWQFGRFEERSASSELITGNLAAEPVPVDQLSFSEEHRFRTVTAAGTFDAAHELVVRRRSQNGRPGFYVVTPLVTGPGQAVLVNRGWVKAGETADTPPEVSPPSQGEVTVTGRLRLSESEETTGIRDRAGLPQGQILLIDSGSLASRLPYRISEGYVELTGQEPAAQAAPEPVPAPEVGAGGGLNFAYGVQWWLFIGVAIGGWVLLIRREVNDRKAAATAS